jgi:outer membrane protein assembly factor BamB
MDIPLHDCHELDENVQPPTPRLERASFAGGEGALSCGTFKGSGTLHCGFIIYSPTFNGGPCNEFDGLSSGLQPCPGCQTGYHAYSVIIDRTDPDDGQIRWHFDGNEYFSVNESQVGAQYWQDVVDHGFFLILDVAMGGSFPNICACTSPNSSTSSGASMGVTYVSVSARHGDA